MNEQLHLLPSSHLASRCVEETSRRDRQSRDERFCYELVKRAFELEDHDALGFVLNIYKDVWSKFWIRDAQAFESRAITMDDFKSVAFLKVYHQLKGGNFDSFPSLNAFLSYLRTTLIRTVAEYYRSTEARHSSIHSVNGADEEATVLLERIASNDNTSERAEKNIMWQEIEKRV